MLAIEPGTTKGSIATNCHREVAMRIGCFEEEFSIPLTYPVFQL